MLIKNILDIFHGINAQKSVLCVFILILFEFEYTRRVTKQLFSLYSLGRASFPSPGSINNAGPGVSGAAMRMRVLLGPISDKILTFRGQITLDRNGHLEGSCRR